MKNKTCTASCERCKEDKQRSFMLKCLDRSGKTVAEVTVMGMLSLYCLREVYHKYANTGKAELYELINNKWVQNTDPIQFFF